ncbi:hypothetical protein SAMN05192574_101650 [Mucilaginibacter gossypiicola]|uniref:Uncharacterized protein n=2 Tax=Sphingobacteriaceae TaxID=84566 RepID=A0A1H8ASS3_9SPHI|nr:hypothetical protein SAMN05192574_101650 [Mucilaginibacter gossypiicola]
MFDNSIFGLRKLPMKAKKTGTLSVDEAIIQNIEEVEQQKELKLINLISEIIVNATLRELNETSDQVSEI